MMKPRIKHNQPQHEQNQGQYLVHKKNGQNLRALVHKCTERPEQTLLTIKELLKFHPDRVIGFVTLGGLTHFNAFLKRSLFPEAILTILLHPNFPFVFEEIESSGLGQTVYNISEKKGKFQKLAKKIFDIWRQQNVSKKKKAVKTQKVRFHSENLLTISVPFEANQSVDTFSVVVARQIRNYFRPATPWETPQVINHSAIVQISINKKCVSETKDEETARQRTVSETGRNRMDTPEEKYTPGRPGKKMKIVPNGIEQKPSVVIPSGEEKQPPQLSEGKTKNDFIDRLFSTMESAGFPNPNSRKRRRPNDHPSEGSSDRSLPKRRFHENGGFDRNSSSRPNNFRNSRPPSSDKRRICRYYNTDRGCVYGDRCYDIHERPTGSRY